MRWMALAAVLSPTLASAQWHLPLDVHNHRSVSLAFLRLVPRSHMAGPNETILSYSLVGANEFRQSAGVDEDAETWRAVVTWEKGLDRRSSVFFELPLIDRSGGFLDSILEWWHGHVINQPDPVREATPKGRAVIGEFGSAFGPGDLTAGMVWRVGPNSLLRAALKLPTGDAARLLGSGAVDLAVAGDWRHPIGAHFTLDANLGLTFQGHATHIDDSQDTVVFSAIALTFAQSSRDAWTVQWSAEQMPARTGTSTLDKDHRLLSFGYQRKLKDGSILQLYFSEDGDFMQFPGGPSLGPDFTVGARLVTRH